MFLVAARQSGTSRGLTLAWPARCTGSGEGTQPGLLTPAAPRDVPLRAASCLGCELGQRPLLGDRVVPFVGWWANGLCTTCL